MSEEERLKPGMMVYVSALNAYMRLLEKGENGTWLAVNRRSIVTKTP